MKTYYDVKQEKLAEIDRWMQTSKILGRDNDHPKKMIQSIMNTCQSDPEDILEKAGYVDIGRGWIRKLNKKERFHAYFADKKIYLHKDVGIKRHRATLDGVTQEFQRMKQFREKKHMSPVTLEMSAMQKAVNDVAKKNKTRNRLPFMVRLIRYLT